MSFSFTKMHGLGNDFMVFNFVHQSTALSSDTIKMLSNRKTGIGFDQLLLIEPATNPDCDFLYRIYNADGSEVEHCGNGARCVARFIADQQLSDKTKLSLQMPNAVIHCTIEDNGLISVDMGAPILNPASVPFIADAQASSYSLALPDNQTVELSAVSVGNPHAVLIVEDVDTAPVETLGPIIENHERFPNRVNVGFMQILSPNNIRLRVFERGVGETLACGTGACAAVVAGQLQGLLAETVTVELIGGTLRIHCDNQDSPILMTGPATTVFEGKIDL